MKTVLEEVGLEQMLEAREKRVERQKELIRIYRRPLISVSINMPGRYKKTPASKIVFEEGCAALFKKLMESGAPPVHREARDPVTGYEAYAVVDMDAHSLKALTLEVEQAHPIGRLLDIDVLGRDGNAVSREMLGYPKRKCLLCGRDAHACARSRAHDMEELLKKIHGLVASYMRQKAVSAADPGALPGTLQEG